MSLPQLLTQFHQQMVEDFAATLQSKLEENIGVAFQPTKVVPSKGARSGARGPSGDGRARIDAAIAEIARERDLRARDVDLLRDAIAGEPRAVILERRAISPNTLKTHVRLLVKKLDVSSMQDAALVVLRRALES